MVCNAVKSFMLENNHMDYSPPFSHAFDGAIMKLRFVGLSELHRHLIESRDGPEALGYYLSLLWDEASQIIRKCSGDISKLSDSENCLISWKHNGPVTNLNALQVLEKQVHKAIQCGLQLHKHFASFEFCPGFPINASVGIACGRMTLVHVGGVYKRLEYHILGKPLYECLEADKKTAGNGGVVITSKAKEVLNDLLLRPEPCSLEGKYFLLNSKSLKGKIRISQKNEKNEARNISSKISRYVPAAVLPFLQYSDPLWFAESRHVTILRIKASFSAKSRITKKHLLGLQTIVQTTMTSIYEYEGSFNKMTIDATHITILTVFGLPPLAHEKDPERAILAATDAHHQFRKLGLRASIGIATGDCKCYLLGNNLHREHMLLGDVVDRTEILMNQDEGKICACNATKLAADNQPRFRFTINDKEKKTWYVSRRDGGVLAFQQKIKVPRYTIGLKSEVNQILDIIKQIQETGEGQVLEVTGDAGLGKTHLLCEVTRTLDQTANGKVHVFWGSGDRFKAGCPYTIWATLLDRALQASGLFRKRRGSRLNENALSELFWKEKPGLAAHLHHANDIIGTNFTSSWESNDRESETIDWCAKIIVFLLTKCWEKISGTCILVVDEGQCMSPEDWRTTMAVINAIDAGQIKDCLLTFSSRPIANEKYKRLFHDLSVDFYDFQATPKTTIVLNNFDWKQTKLLIKKLIAHDQVDDSFVDMVLNKTGGNPLYVVKFITLLTGLNAIKIPSDPREALECVFTEDLWNQIPVPYRLQRMLFSFIDRLTPSQVLILRMGATLCYAEDTATTDFYMSYIKNVHPMEEWRSSQRIHHDLSYLLKFEFLREVTGIRQHNKSTTRPGANNGTRYEFSCGFLRDVVYDGMLSAQKARLHKLFATYFTDYFCEDLSRIRSIDPNRWADRLAASHQSLMLDCDVFQEDADTSRAVRMSIANNLFTIFGARSFIPLCLQDIFENFHCCTKKRMHRAFRLSPAKPASWELGSDEPQTQLILQNPMIEKTEYNIRIRDDMCDLEDISNEEAQANEAGLKIMRSIAEDTELSSHLCKKLTDLIKFLTSNSSDPISKYLPLMTAEAVTFKRLLKVTGNRISSSLINDQISTLLAQTSNWNFEIFELANATKYPLMYMSFKILRQYDILSKFKIDLKKLVNFLYVVEIGYNINNNPYHNSCHAADTLQSCSVMMDVVLRHHELDSLSIYALLLSCIIHDFVHPGLTSPFCMKYSKTKTNIKAVLERVHMVAFLKVLELPECDILSEMREENKEQYSKFINLVRTFVLSTDLSTHFLFIDKAKRILEREESFEPKNEQAKHKQHALLMRMCIKCADVSNATKAFDIYDVWADRILQEFYSQGDIENSKGMQITNYMNRNERQKSECQFAFIDKIVRPVVELFGEFFPDAQSLMQTHMRQNMAHHAPKTTN